MSVNDERSLRLLLPLQIADYQIVFSVHHLKNLLFLVCRQQEQALAINPSDGYLQCIEDNHSLLLHHLIRTSR